MSQSGGCYCWDSDSSFPATAVAVLHVQQLHHLCSGNVSTPQCSDCWWSGAILFWHHHCCSWSREFLCSSPLAPEHSCSMVDKVSHTPDTQDVLHAWVDFLLHWEVLDTAELLGELHESHLGVEGIFYNDLHESNHVFYSESFRQKTVHSKYASTSHNWWLACSLWWHVPASVRKKTTF